MEDNIYKFIKKVNKETDDIWKQAITSDNGWVKQGTAPVNLTNPKSITDYFRSLYNTDTPIPKPNIIHVDFKNKTRRK